MVNGMMININKAHKVEARAKDDTGYDFVRPYGCCHSASRHDARVLVIDNIGTHDHPVFIFKNTCCGHEYAPARGER